MKLGLFLLAIAVVLGGLVGTLVIRDPGYVLLAYSDYALETSLWFAVVALFALYFAIRLGAFLLTRMLNSGGKLGSWLQQRKGRAGSQQTVQGLLLMAEGEWQQARKVLTGAAGKVASPLINYLTAARAAHELQDVKGRDDLLRQAHESTPGSRFAVALTQAQLQMSAAQWEQCLATLLQLREESPRHPLVLKMLARCYRELGDWEALQALLPALRKAKALAEEELAELNAEAWLQRLEVTQAPLDEFWQGVPKDLKRSASLVAAYARRARAADCGAQALPLLRACLQQNWDQELVALYGQISGDNPAEQLKVAEGWLKDRGNDAQLLLALGRICLMNAEWSKAREYLEAGLRVTPVPEVYAELGRLCVAMGEVEHGSEFLVRAAPGLTELPLPTNTQASSSATG